jgi:hypothetical protein
VNIVGTEYLHSCIAEPGYFLKLVINERAAHFFPYNIEHRDASLVGLTYRDDSEGDALAATIKPTQVDIRIHKAFSTERVMAIAQRLEQSLAPERVGQVFAIHYGGVFVAQIYLA